MAKHPVPKQKTAKSKSRKRYGAYKSKQVRKLEGMVAGSRHRLKKANEVLKDAKKQKEVDKIKKVKA